MIQTHPPTSEPTPTLPPVPPTQSRNRLSSTREQPARRLSNAARAEGTRSNSISAQQQNQQQQQQQTPPSHPQTLESLTQELSRVNRETAEITAQLDLEEEKNRAEIAKLESELEDLRARRKEDDDSKAGLRAETKQLEEQKRSIDAQKLKLEKTLRTVQDELTKLESEASARLRDLAEKEQDLVDLRDQTANAERQVKEAETSGREELMEAQRQIGALEENNRLLAQKIAIIKSQTEKKDPNEERARIKTIDEHEDVEDLKVEQEWIESENALKARQDQVRSQLDEVLSSMYTELMQANREFREALALLVQARELHTAAHSVSSGKPRTKKRSKRTRHKALNIIGQQNHTSPSLAASDPLITASRPASFVLPSGADIGMFYPSGYPDPTMMPYEYQSSSPWASTHSLGMLHDVLLPIDTTLDRERLTTGALLSPSVSEHLLPSNLFGPDEDSVIRTNPYIDRLLQSPSASITLRTPPTATAFPPSAHTTDSPLSERSTHSSFSSPNQSLHTLPLHYDQAQSSPTIIMTPAPHYTAENIVKEEEPVEVASPAELNGIPLSAESAENSDDEIPIGPNESTSPLKHWKIPSISFKRKAIPPEKRLPILGTLKGEKSRSMPRTSAGAIPIGFNRPRSGSSSSSGWLYVKRARAPSETGRQFDINFDPLESRRLLEGAGVVHHHSTPAKPVGLMSPRASFESRSTTSRRSTDPELARLYSPSAATGYLRTPSVYSEISSSYGWISQPMSTTVVQGPISLPTSPAGMNSGGNSMLNDRWSPPNTSRSSLDPKAPEFRTNLQQFLTPGPESEPEPEPEPGVLDASPKRGGGLFALPKRSVVRPGDSFLNNFTGLFRREPKIGEDENTELSRPKSQDTQTSGDPSAATGVGSVEDLPLEATPEKKKKEKKKKDKTKGKSIFRWESKADSTEDPELTSSKSLESIKGEGHDNNEPPRRRRRGKKGVKFEKEGEIITSSIQISQDTEIYSYQDREVATEEAPVK